MSGMISYARPDGKASSGYMVEPTQGSKAPGVVVIQEWWGLDDQIKGVAEKLFVKPGSPKSVYEFIKEAHEAGVTFKCCSPNLDLFDMTKEDLIPECSGIVGGAYLIEEVMETDCKVLTY